MASWLRARVDSKERRRKEEARSPPPSPAPNGFNADIWPSVVPEASTPSPTTPSRLASGRDFTLGLEAQHSPPATRTRVNEKARESSDDSPVERLAADSLGRLRKGQMEEVQRVTKSSSNSDETFGGQRRVSPPSASSHGGSNPSSGSAGSRGWPSRRHLSPTVYSSSPNGTLHSRESRRSSPSAFDYQLAENLLLAGRVSTSSLSSRYVTGQSHSVSEAEGGAAVSSESDSIRSRKRPEHLRLTLLNSSFRTLGEATARPAAEEEEETQRLPPKRESDSSPQPASLSSPDVAALRRNRSLPSLVDGEESSDSDTEASSEADWQDAHGGLTEDEAEAPVMVKVRLANTAALIYSAGSTPRTSVERTRKESIISYARQTTLFLAPSPQLSPTSQYSPLSSPTKGSTLSRTSSRSSEIEIEDDYVELPVPPAPLQSKSLYSPTESTNFLPAPPSKLRRRFKRESRQQRRRALSEGSRPRLSGGPIGPYRHPGADETDYSPKSGSPHQASPRLSQTISRIFARTPSSRGRRSQSQSRHSKTGLPSPTYLSQSARGPTMRRSALIQKHGVQSVWSANTEAVEEETASQLEGDISASTIAPETWLDKLWYDLSLVPLGAWLFAVGFVFPPCWWIGSYVPRLTTRPGQVTASPVRNRMLDDRLPRSPQTPRDRLSYRHLNGSVLPPSEVSVDRLPLPSPLSDFLSDSPSPGLQHQEATMWARNKAVWQWRLRNRVMSILSLFVLSLVIVFAVLGATMWKQ